MPPMRDSSRNLAEIRSPFTIVLASELSNFVFAGMEARFCAGSPTNTGGWGRCASAEMWVGDPVGAGIALDVPAGAGGSVAVGGLVEIENRGLSVGRRPDGVVGQDCKVAAGAG